MSDISNSGTQAARPNPPPAFRDNDGNEITPAGKFFAGLLLVLITAFCTLYLVGHWPSRIPKAGDNTPAFYTYQWFQVNLAVDCSEIKGDRPAVNPKSNPQQSGDNTDSTEVIDSTPRNTQPQKDSLDSRTLRKCLEENASIVHFNTLLLILVAVSGFLGNMIHVASSFTTFVGAGKFRKSWTLWYFVKPFTASALAVIMYFIFRGGLLNMSDDSTNLNIYGLITLSLLTGLFTDRATVKMQEVFEVLLRPKEERPDPLKGSDPKITGVKADPLEAGKPIVIALMGENLEKGKIEITVEGQPILTVDRRPDCISFTYTLPENLKDKEAVELSVKLEKDKEAGKYPLKVKSKEKPQGPQDLAMRPEDIVPYDPDQDEPEKPLGQG